MRKSIFSPEKSDAIMAWVERAFRWTGPIAGGAMTTWVAQTIDWLNAYGPITWWAAFLLGVLITVWILNGWTAFRLRNARLAFVKQQETRSDIVNPLEDTFQRRRVNINELRSVDDWVIENKTFIRCEIVGPATVYFDNATLNANGFRNCIFVLARIGARIPSAIIMRRVTIQDSTLYAMTVIVPENQKDSFEQGTARIEWINV